MTFWKVKNDGHRNTNTTIPSSVDIIKGRLEPY